MTERVVTHDTVAPLRDGTLLATDVSHVDDGVRRPALLVRTPYSRPAARETLDVAGLAQDGWAVVLQDVRGRWESTGTFRPFVQESVDGAAAIGWCAEQSWCDGRVLMTGASYLGATQWAAASQRPAALVAINPMLAPASPPADWLWQGGAFHIGMAMPWMLTMRATGCDVDDDERARLDDEIEQWRHAPEVVPDDRWLVEADPDYREWRSARTPGAWGPSPWHTADVPALNVVGWHDFFAEQGLAAHARQVARGVPVTTVVGPWAHDGRAADAVDVETLAWLRARLAGAPVDSEIRYLVTGTDEWRRSTSWPPTTRPTTLYLGNDGLTTEIPAATGSASWSHDPSAPVPSCGGRVLGPFLPLGGARDQREVERRPDVLTFTGPALGQALVVAGHVTADLVATSSAETFDLAVKLCDVHPDGRAVNVVDGIVRIDRDRRHGHVQVGSAAHAFGVGHRVRVEIAGSNFPRFDINPPVPATHTVHWGPAATSRVTLPVARSL